MSLFEKFHVVLEKTILAELSKSLPPNAGVASQWKDASQLYWFGVSVDALQDGKLYAGYSFGKAQNPKKLYQENLSRPEFDYDGCTRFDMADKDEALYFDIRLAIKTGTMELGAEPDEDADWDDEIDTAPPTLIALTLVAQRLQKEPKLIPMPRANTFSVTISDDYESATWAVSLETLSNTGFDDWTDEQIDAFFGTFHAPLAKHLRELCTSEKAKETTLAAAIEAFAG